MSDPREIIYDAQPASVTPAYSTTYHAEQFSAITLYLANDLDVAINVEIQASYDHRFRHMFSLGTVSLNAGTVDRETLSDKTDFLRAVITPLATAGSGTVRVVASGRNTWGPS